MNELDKLKNAEPVQAPCMLLGLASGRYDEVSVQDIGLTGQTEADGLAVGRCSGLVSHIMRKLLSGEATVEDDKLPVYMNKLWRSEGIFIEPSSCAAFAPYGNVMDYLEKNDNITHIIWATGGSLVPEEEKHKLGLRTE